MQVQENNLKIYLNNIPYDQKNMVHEHILKLIKTNQSLWVNSSVAKNKDDTFYCYIEVTGFTNIGTTLHQIRIIFPHNYPVAPPQFNLAYNPDQYTIENQAILINDRTIALETNSANELQINLQLPFLKAFWKSQKKNVNDAYIELQKCLNNPPLLTPKVQINRGIRQSVNNYGGNSYADRFMEQVEMRALKLKDSEDQINKGQREIDYNHSRNEFFKRNLPKLSKAMKSYEQNTQNKVIELQSMSEKLTFERNCDVLLELSEKEKEKIKILAARQGYKQGERRLTCCLQKELPQNTCNFGEYRNMIRSLYQKMFQSQTNYLKISD